MSNTHLILGANWDIGDWPEFVSVNHEAALAHGEFGLSRRYVPERVRKVTWEHIGGDVAAGYCGCGMELDRRHGYEPAHLPRFCPWCGAKVVE